MRIVSCNGSCRFSRLQSPALTEALARWLAVFKNDWVGNETTQQLHAHIRQRQVHGLCQSLVLKKQRLKTSKEEVGPFWFDG